MWSRHLAGGRHKMFGAILVGLLVVGLVIGLKMLRGQSMVLSGHSDSVRSVAFSPDGTTLASGSEDTTIRIWDVRTEKEMATLEVPEGRYLGPEASRGTVYDPVSGRTPPFFKSIAFAPDGKQVAAGASDRSIRIWNVGTAKQILKIELDPSGPFGRGNDVFGIAFSPDGKVLASGSFDGVVRLWSAETGKLIRSFEGHVGIVYGVAFSSNGKLLASCGKDHTVRVWDRESGRETQTLKGHSASVYCVAFAPSCESLASGGGDVDRTEPLSELRLWQVATGKELAALVGHKGAVRAVAFSSDGSLLASAGGNQHAGQGEIRLWEISKRKEVGELSGHRDLVYSVAFSPDGKLLASGSGDKTIRVWDIKRIVGDIGK